jgi:ribosomal protein S18 acetylase RimI-like enzyme
MGKPRYTLILETNPNPADVDILRANLTAYNIAQMRGDDHYEQLLLTLRDNQRRIVGGIAVGMFWSIAEVDFLWVHDDLRGQGYGRDLLKAAEREAAQRGCVYVFLDTFSFQSPGFYQKLGYEIVSEIRDYPPGHSKFTMKKALSAAE